MTSQATLDQAIKVKPAVSQAKLALVQNLGVAMFGFIILFAVGFLPLAAAHNAAHDTRHVLAFPCH